MDDLFQQERHSERCQKLEAAGIENVRAMVALATMMRTRGDLAIGSEHMPMEFVREWLKWHDDRRAAKSATQLEQTTKLARWAAVAAFLSFVAAAASFLL